MSGLDLLSGAAPSAASVDSGASGNGDSGGATGSISIPSTPVPPTTPGATVDFNALVPVEFQNETWVKDLARNADPVKALFERHKSAQAMIGKRVEVPAADATPEAVKAFHKALGVPDSPDRYEYSPPDISAESEGVQKYLKEEAKDSSFMKAMQSKAHELGLTPKQFAGMASAVDGWKIENARGTVEALQAQGEQRLTTFNTLYGDKADYVKRVAKETLGKVIPENIMKSGDPEIVLFEALKFIHEKVYKNGSVAAGSSGTPQMSPTELQQEIFKLRALPEFKNAFHPNHKALNAKVEQMYVELEELKRQ